MRETQINREHMAVFWRLLGAVACVVLSAVAFTAASHTAIAPALYIVSVGSILVGVVGFGGSALHHHKMEKALRDDDPSYLHCDDEDCFNRARVILSNGVEKPEAYCADHSKLWSLKNPGRLPKLVVGEFPPASGKDDGNSA
jgi:hypothetical protein